MTQLPPQPLDPQVLAALRRRMAPGTDWLSLDSYIACVLYDAEAGYYRRPRERVGRRAGTDFYTGPSLGPVFSRLMLAALRELAPDPLESYTFVEAGPESAGGILGHLPEHPFRDVRLVRPGEPLDIPPRAIVFSNELFDAQPFRRLVFRDGAWQEVGVALRAETLELVERAPFAPLPPLPAAAPEGYTVDWPEAAHALLDSICAQQWEGLFVAVDYGLDRATVLAERPAGTGRTYAGHRMGADLLENPGHTDITCHVLWDELEEILRARGFSDIRLERQEAFLVRHAAAAIQAIVAAAGPAFSRDKQTLMELLHPSHMGGKFQVLAARRREAHL